MSKYKFNMSINLNNWILSFLDKEEARCVEARNIISRFLDEIRNIDWNSKDFYPRGNTLFTSYFREEDYKYIKELIKRRIFFSFSELGRIAFFEHYREKLFKKQIHKEPELDYLKINNIKVLREA